MTARSDDGEIMGLKHRHINVRSRVPSGMDPHRARLCHAEKFSGGGALSAVWFNGAFAAGTLPLDPNDRGFLLGDGVFETVAVINRKPLWLDGHVHRMAMRQRSLHSFNAERTFTGLTGSGKERGAMRISPHHPEPWDSRARFGGGRVRHPACSSRLTSSPQRIFFNPADLKSASAAQ